MVVEVGDIPGLGDVPGVGLLLIVDMPGVFVGVAVEFSKKYGIVTVLKNFRTVIADTDGSYFINTTGCSAMAKGGSGDCLAGTVGGLIAQGLGCFEAAYLGCYINGRAAEFACRQKGDSCAKASDILKNIHLAVTGISDLEQNND